jgi:hypothetical protein
MLTEPQIHAGGLDRLSRDAPVAGGDPSLSDGLAQLLGGQHTRRVGQISRLDRRTGLGGSGVLGSTHRESEARRPAEQKHDI